LYDIYGHFTTTMLLIWKVVFGMKFDDMDKISSDLVLDVWRTSHGGIFLESREPVRFVEWF